MTDEIFPFETGDRLSAAALNQALADGRSNQWRSIAGPPVDATGKDGDQWLDTTTGIVYERQLGVYVARGNLVGPPGAAGPAGAAGPPGPPGVATAGVTRVDTSGAGISGGPITNSGAITVQWNAGDVTALDPTTLQLTAGTLKSIGATVTGTAGGDLTGTYPNPTLKTSGVTGGVYGDQNNVPVITVNAKGIVTTMGTAAIGGGGGGSAKGKAGGDLTGTYPDPSLQTTSVVAGSYGSASLVPTFTVDGKGRLTAASTVAIAGGPPSGAASGDLGGTYPSPIVQKTGGASFAASATTDTTNAANITTGLLPVARLPASGVVASTYGDATNVPRVTVDGAGRVTGATTVALTAPAVSFAVVTGVATYAQLPAAVQQVPISFPFSGKPSTGTIVNVPVAMAMTVPASLAGAKVYDSTKTTSDAAFTVNRISAAGATTALGTVTVTSASNTSATLAGAGGSLAVGDVLQMVAPTQDATLSDVGITLLCARV